MARDKFELTDLSDSQTNLTTAQGRKATGCHVSTAVGFVLVLLAAAVAVGVGIIVHFAGGNRDLVCNCQSSLPEKPSTEAIIQECINQASQGNTEICHKCPASSTTHLPATTAAPALTTVPATATVPATIPATEPPKVTDVRLPRSVYPLHYDVELQPYMQDLDPKEFTFKGSVRILVRCDEPTDNVTLHVNVLEVNKSSIRFFPETTSTSSDPKALAFEEDKDRQFFIVRLSKNMEKGKHYVLEMSFTSPLKNDLHGLYYSQYTRDNQTIYLATTQFQPTDARKAFPCFDEPAIKATFNITLVRPSHLVSISNMPIISNTTFEENGKTYVKDVYQKTPEMSTYLLAFIICDFEYKWNETKNGTLLYRAWATPQSINQTDYSLTVGVDVIQYFEDYFNVTYPLPKQDMIAIPDFAAGAMENWGLITYRETAMLYKEGVSNEANRERIAVVVSHELAHQWFGNLVTPSWWDDLWLNEGFASFVEYLGVDKVHPDWKMFDKFVISDLQDAFRFDGLTSSHPVYVPVAHPDEINEIFDTISYAKGASIIRMMRHFLGVETFRKGITQYLTDLSYKAAFHDDLWNSLTKQSVADGNNISVKAVMDTWVLQMNYPVVTVSVSGNSTVLVTQERYLSDPNATDPEKYKSPFGYRWTIPLTLTSSSDPQFDLSATDVLWLDKSEGAKNFNVSIKLPLSSDKDGWILANVQQNGYYRVNYEEGNWRALTKQLNSNHSVISVINRAQIINDAWNLAKAGDISLTTALWTIEYLEQERDYIPWLAARSELNYVESMLSHTAVYGLYQRFMKKTLIATYSHFDLSNVQQEHINIGAQSLIAGQSCYYGIEPCLDAVSKQYSEWMKNPSNNTINPNLKTVVYCYAIASGGFDEWQFALDMYSESDVASEKANLLSAMSCSKEIWILNHYMQLILQENSPIRKQDALSVVSSVARNNVGRLLAWNFFRENYDVLKDQFGSSFFAWSGVIGAVTESFNTDFYLKEVSAFKEKVSGNVGSGERAFNQALDRVSSNIKWMHKNMPLLTDWLKTKTI